MGVILSLFEALWNHDVILLADPKVAWALYIILFTIIFLENGILPAAFLPGDSLLLLVGVLLAKGNMNFLFVLCLLTAAASLGSWLGYVQGRLLSNSNTVKNWLSHIPEHYHTRTHLLFYKHGLAALFIGRFIAFVRTLMPTLAGISGLSNRRFQIFNWFSGLLWILTLVTLGYFFGNTRIFDRYEDQLMRALMLIPIGLLVFGLIASIIVVWRKKTQKK